MKKLRPENLNDKPRATQPALYFLAKEKGKQFHPARTTPNTDKTELEMNDKTITRSALFSRVKSFIENWS